nr:unnamed protein product [Digitaria exilis]
MSHKRRRNDNQNQRAGGGDNKRRPHKHLYLVLNDWEKGFSIHKIDPDTFDSDDEDQHSGAASHLPDPPSVRLEIPIGDDDEDMSDTSFAAMGTKIFAFTNHRCGLVYDVETAALSIGAHAPDQMACGSGVFMAAGDVLYALTHRDFNDLEQPHSFEAMSWAPAAAAASSDPMRQQPTRGWSWKTLPSPAFHSHVHSYALHPDGHTIFMTSSDDSHRMCTYSFDTIDSAWRSHGEWALPFRGQGHFDSELDAWVGLHREGYVCTCQVISPDFHSTAPCFYPDCKMTKEKLFRNMSSKRHMSVSLTRMGTTEFCLVECVAAKKEEKRAKYNGCVIHLTIFGLKYNHRGELQIKDHQSSRSFVVPSDRFHFDPQAFWM